MKMKKSRKHRNKTKDKGTRRHSGGGGNRIQTPYNGGTEDDIYDGHVEVFKKQIGGVINCHEWISLESKRVRNLAMIAGGLLESFHSLCEATMMNWDEFIEKAFPVIEKEQLDQYRQFYKSGGVGLLKYRQVSSFYEQRVKNVVGKTQ